MRTNLLFSSTAIASMTFLLIYTLPIGMYKEINITRDTASPIVFETSNNFTGTNAAVINVQAFEALTNLKINFQDAATLPPADWLRDYGQAYGPRSSANQGSGYTYGWKKRSDRTLLDMTSYGRNRNSPSDILLATLMHMQPSGASEGIWEAQVVNGDYNVTVSVGDGGFVDSKHSINVEGVQAIVNFVPTTSTRFKSATVSVSVTDGLLTIDAIGGTNTKINYITIQPKNSSMQVNFQDAATVPPADWLRDYGQAYGPRSSANQGSGYTYGWVKSSDNTPLDMSTYGRKRTTPADILLATLMHMQPNSTTQGKWEAQVPNGNYDVTVSVGDGSYFDSKHTINVEGVQAIVNFVPTTSTPFKSAAVSVNVADGRLTVDATGGTNTKINYITIQPKASNWQVNFQDSATVPPGSWLRDYGQAYGPRSSANQGSGFTYGWVNRENQVPLDLTKNGRRRTKPSDILLATLMCMQGDDVVNFNGTPIEGRWEMQVPNGIYDVTVSVGDAVYYGPNKQSINIEGVLAMIDFISTGTVPFKTATVTVQVADGRLTIDAFGGNNTKINYVSITPSSTKKPFVVSVNPKNRAENVGEYNSISTNVLHLPNGGINNATITPSTVYLTEGPAGPVVPANVNGTGGGDAITLVPSAPLKLNTTYVFNVTSGVKDLSGAGFIPFSSAFTTTSTGTMQLPNVKFTKVQLSNTVGRHASLTIGPDGKLYALTIDGIIKRFPINADGTLGTPQLIYSLQDAYGSTRQPRLAVGFTFDPSSTTTNLIAWVTHSSFVFQNGPEWDGRLTKLSGSNLQNVQDILINLPRSTKDHLTNSVAFGPDGALYINQGGNSAMGKADLTWGNREEHLLSAAILRLDPTKLGSLPLNVKTSEGGGSYNPYATNAPLTIYASGVRNAYDLVWHSNGQLYVPTNGSAAGGNTPESVAGTLRPDGTTYNGPFVPALTDVQQTQSDFLFRVIKGGYYGHPNPLRGEYVLNGGNPTTGTDRAQVDAYTIGTKPDINWRGFAFDFQTNKSPDGVIEYKSNTFNGALKGKLLVVRYSQNDDIIVLTPGGTNNDIVSFNEGGAIQGFTGFVDPLDLVEDVRNGNIYVSEYGGNGKITLLKPNVTSTSNIVSADNANVEQSDFLNYLAQNAPNPFNNTTVIRYYIPFNSRDGKLFITDMKGAVVEARSLTNGQGQVVINKGELAVGTYIYSLWIDGKQVASKKMILNR